MAPERSGALVNKNISNYMRSLEIKKNIGILFPFSKSYGGTVQYTLGVADSLVKYSNKFNYTIIYYDKDIPNYLTSKNIDIKEIYITSAKTPPMKIIALFSNLVLNKKIFNMKKNDEISRLKDHNIDMLVIPFPSLFGFRNNIPYIVTIPDMMYRYFPNLPEYPLKVRIRRDIEYKNASKQSALTIVDSLQGKNDLNNFLKIDKKKIRVIPYLPPGYVYSYKDMSTETAGKILEKFNLPERFLFYPAQFWFHKNHIRLIKAIDLIRKKYKIKVSLALVGSPQESYKKIMNMVKELDLSDQIYHLGYVTDKEIVALYKKSQAMVFPDLLGPTNIQKLVKMR